MIQRARLGWLCFWLGALLVACSQQPGVMSVSVEPDSFKLEIGEEQQFQAEVKVRNGASERVLWETSDRRVAVVDSQGEVRAVGSGEAVITAISAFDTSKSASASVLVGPAVRDLELGAARETMLPGERQTLELTVEGSDEAVNWESSNEDVLSVDEKGVVYARSSGESTVRATSRTIPDVSAELTIRVTDGEANESPGAATALPPESDGLLFELTPGDMDWYRLELGEARVLNVRVDAAVLGSAADTVLGLFDDAGELLLINDDSSGVDPALKQVLTAGTYYLAVTGASDYDFEGDHRQAGLYRLHLTKSTPPDLALRPERLRVEVEPDERVEATLSLTNTGSDSLSYSLIDGEAGFELAGAGATGSARRWQQLVGRARAKARLEPREAWQLEPVLSDPLGDTFAEGSDLRSVSADLAGGRLTLQLELAEGSFDSARFAGVIELDLDQSATSGAEPLGFCDSLPIGPDRYLTRAPGSDRVVLRDQTLTELADYPLTLVGDSALAVTLPLSDLGDDGNIDIAVNVGTSDVVSDCAPNSGKATIGEPGQDLDPVTLSPSSGTLSAGESREITLTVDSEGLSEGTLLSWQVLVTTDSPLTPARRIDIDIEVVASRDRNEPNNDAAQATPLTSGARSGLLSVAQNDVDWFSFTLDARALVVADLDARRLEPPSGLDSLVALLDAEQTLISLDDGSEDAFLEVLLEPGDYYLVVTAYPDYDLTGNHDGGGSYELLLSTVPPPEGAVSGQIFTPYEPLSPASLGIPETARFVPGQALVKFEAEAGLRSQSLLNSLGFYSEAQLGGGVTLVSRLMPAAADASAATLELVRSLRALPEVTYAEPNYIREAFRLPDDAAYSQQWHYDAIHLEAAWDLTTGSSDVQVAVLDTGVASAHPDLNCGRLQAGYDFIDDDADPEDEGPFNATVYHGTHVLGTVGACSDNGVGVTGVDWRAGLSAVRVLGPLGGTDADIARGIRWAAGLELPGTPVNAAPAFVINLSLGGPGYSQTLQDAVNDATRAGSIIVAAAGNNADDASAYAPAGLANVMTVGATNPSSALSWYSNYGDAVDLLAPGGALEGTLSEDVLSTIRAEDESYDYAFYAGTSMAAPHVSGVIALMKAVKPDLDPVYARAYLLASTTPVGGLCDELGCGAGLLDAAAAVQAAATNAPIGAFVSASERLDFGADTPELRFELANLGDEAAELSLVAGNGALSVSPARLRLVAGERQTIALGLERGAFEEGSYQTRLTVAYGDATLGLPIFFRVGGGKVDLGDLKVELYRVVDTGYRRYAEMTSRYGAGYSYRFEGVAPGSYAVSVFDASGEVSGQQFFELAKDERLEDLDVTLERSRRPERPAARRRP